MYHQFKELADVDITKQPMEIGPTCHYVMGGVEVDAGHRGGRRPCPGLFAAGEVSGGMHGSNRLGGNSLSDLLVFGKRAGEYAARVRRRARRERPTGRRQSDVDAAVETALAPLDRGAEGENPYDVWHDLQDGHAGPGRHHPAQATSWRSRSSGWPTCEARVANVGATGGRKFNPGWHLALDLRNMLVVSECTARAALEREESRGGHTREDFPEMDPKWRQVNLVCSLTTGDGVDADPPAACRRMRAELLGLFERVGADEVHDRGRAGRSTTAAAAEAA